MRKEHGFTLLEVLVALTILSVGIIAVLQLFPYALRQARGAAEGTIAVQLADSKLGQLHAAGVGDELSNWVSQNGQYQEILDRIEDVGAIYRGYAPTVQRISVGGASLYRVTFSIMMENNREKTFVTYITEQ